MKFTVKSENDFDDLIQHIIPLVKKYNCILLYGNMGYGKTTFVQQFLKKIKVEYLNGSPSYSLINNYFIEEYGNIYHLDLYRLNSLEEIFDIGIEEVLFGNSIKFIEWPEKIVDLIKEDYLELFFKLNTDFSRTVILKKLELKKKYNKT
jgi:tRNA threonylcarbamoyladenosine biosynthesis protein TsaE